MEAKSKKQSTENFIKDIRRKTRRLFSSEQKILIVMEALRGELSVSEICRKHGINQSQFYKWNKEFMENSNTSSHFLPVNVKISLNHLKFNLRYIVGRCP